MKRNNVVIIIGQICSGKSTLAREVHTLVKESKVISFSSYLKFFCTREKIDYKGNRTVLQDLGQQFINTNSNKFLNDCINFHQISKQDLLIFEGVRHIKIFDAIRSKYPKTISIYLDIPEEERFFRYNTRENEIDLKVSYDGFKKKDKHVVELEIQSIKSKCDLVIQNINKRTVSNLIKKFL